MAIDNRSQTLLLCDFPHKANEFIDTYATFLYSLLQSYDEKSTTPVFSKREFPLLKRNKKQRPKMASEFCR